MIGAQLPDCVSFMHTPLNPARRPLGPPKAMKHLERETGNSAWVWATVCLHLCMLGRAVWVMVWPAGQSWVWASRLFFMLSSSWTIFYASLGTEFKALS